MKIIINLMIALTYKNLVVSFLDSLNRIVGFYWSKFGLISAILVIFSLYSCSGSITPIDFDWWQNETYGVCSNEWFGAITHTYAVQDGLLIYIASSECYSPIDKPKIRLQEKLKMEQQLGFQVEDFP